MPAVKEAVMGNRFRHSVALVAVLVMALALLPGTAGAHIEREGFWPEAEERVIPQVRTDGPAVVVCKPDSERRLLTMPRDVRQRNLALLEQCEFTHIQDAVDWVNANGEPGYRILVLPGLYRENPNRVLEGACAEEKADHDQVFTYEDHLECPHAVALIHILGQDADQVGEPAEHFSTETACRNNLCDLQIEGTGASPLDVVIDGGYNDEGGWIKEDGIRGDRVDGLVLHNFTIQRFGHNGIYVLETDGYRFDRTVARWNEAYAYLNFMTDNGLYVDCEGYGSGDGAIYPGSQPQHERENWSAIVRGCSAHRNMLGLSGTAGNSLLVEDNDFFDNSTGWQTDSFVPDHPGMPTGYSSWNRNRVFRNNMNYYDFLLDGTCDGPPSGWGYEQGVVCPTFPAPVGTGIWLPGGNHMHYTNNEVWDNWRNGFMQFYIPPPLREDFAADPFDNSHFNRYTGNRLGFGPNGDVRPNGNDFWWDDQGEGNCWQDNVPAMGEVTHNSFYPGGLPTCDDGGSQPMPLNLIKSSPLAPCATFDRHDNPDPPTCDWAESPPMPEGREVTVTTTRLSGAGRIATALEVSRRTFERSDAVVLARADDYPDALAGAPLAALMEAPILLTPPGGLDPAVAAEIGRLGATRAYLLGGTAALSAAVQDQVLAQGVAETFRIAGADRYTTAVRIAELIGGPVAYVVKGHDTNPDRAWPDALSTAAAAAVQRRPLLLAAPDHLPAVTAQALRDLTITDATLVGGESALSADVLAQVSEAVERADRLGGTDRYDTARLVAERSRLIYANDTDLWVATGANWPDALVAGPAVAATRGVLLLVPTHDVGTVDAVEAWFDARPGATERIHVLGGLDAISATIAAQLEGLAMSGSGQ
jgi:putative cell wall-binding protein